MKKLVLLCTAILLGVCSAAQGQAVNATVCEILKNPQAFNGKTVQVQATVRAGFDMFILVGDNCGQGVNGIWLSYPEGTKGKAGPAVVLEFQAAKSFTGKTDTTQRAQVTLEKSKEFKQFDSLLSTAYKSGGLCIGCVKNEVTATLTGRLDASETSLKRDTSGHIVEIGGFGHLNMYKTRLVLQSVTGVTAKEIDYAFKLRGVTTEALDNDGPADAISGMKQAEKNFGATTPSGALIRRAIDAFGKPGDDNGVMVSPGWTNEANAKREGVSTSSSPDGVLYYCLFDMNRLKGVSLSVAIAFDGAMIADMRSSDARVASASVYELEARAYNVELMTAVAFGAKAFVLPGGTVYWNNAWPANDRGTNLQNAIFSYLADQEVFHH